MAEKEMMKEKASSPSSSCHDHTPKSIPNRWRQSDRPESCLVYGSDGSLNSGAGRFVMTENVETIDVTCRRLMDEARFEMDGIKEGRAC